MYMYMYMHLKKCIDYMYGINNDVMCLKGPSHGMFFDQPKTCPTGFLLEAGSRVPAPVCFEQITRLLKVQN